MMVLSDVFNDNDDAFTISSAIFFDSLKIVPILEFYPGLQSSI